MKLTKQVIRNLSTHRLLTIFRRERFLYDPNGLVDLMRNELATREHLPRHHAPAKIRRKPLPFKRTD